MKLTDNLVLVTKILIICTLDGHLLCFDEKNDQIISINIKTGQWIRFSVPENLRFQYFYWANLLSLSGLFFCFCSILLKIKIFSPKCY